MQRLNQRNRVGKSRYPKTIHHFVLLWLFQHFWIHASESQLPSIYPSTLLWAGALQRRGRGESPYILKFNSQHFPSISFAAYFFTSVHYFFLKWLTAILESSEQVLYTCVDFRRVVSATNLASAFRDFRIATLKPAPDLLLGFSFVTWLLPFL